MDQTVINWVLTGLGATLGWIMKVIWDAIRELKSDMKQIERDLPEIYVRKDDFRETVKGLREDLHEVKTDMKDGFRNIHEGIALISRKLDHKEDKERH